METSVHILLIDRDPAAALRVREAAAGADRPALLVDWVASAAPPTAAEGPAAGAATARPPDVVLLGLSGPDVAPAVALADALAAVRRRWASVPVVLLTDPADGVAYLLGPAGPAGGAQDCLRREAIDADTLARTVRHVVAVRQAELAREAAADRQNLLRRIIDNVPDHVYAKDRDGRFTVVNTATQEFFGAATADELIGKTDFDLFPPDVAGWFQAEERELLQSGRPCLNREAEVTDAAGHRRWVITNKAPLWDAGGRVIGIVGINRDVTERKRAMEQLRDANDALAGANESLARANASLAQANSALARRERELVAVVEDLRRSHEELRAAQLGLVQAAKLESVGRLAAGVAHEVKNPLAVLAMGVDYLSNCPGFAGAGAAEGVAQALRSMREAARKADQVIRGLLDFSAPTTLVTAPADLNAVVDQALVLVGHDLARSGIDLRRELAADLPSVAVDANKVEQVFVNLLMNAVHAMPDAGRLTVRTYAGRAASDPTVVAEVDDTGPGVPADLLPRVFDPFFTTKPAGKGSGLGLSVAKTIVELHGGTIAVANRPDGGARATVTLRVGRTKPGSQKDEG